MSSAGITIDDVHSTDLDDALWAEPCGDGTKIHVTIAAASVLATPASTLDAGARARAVTRYFAGGHSSMLPRGVEEKLSLLPGVKRQGVAVVLAFDAAGERTAATVEPVCLRSRAKLAYGDIPGILATSAHPLHDVMARLMAVATRLLAARRQRGAFVLYDFMSGWVASEEGHVKKIERAADAAGHIIVQELMIAANVAVAEYALANVIPVLYRNHQAVGAERAGGGVGPDRGALVALLDEAARKGEPVGWLEEVRRQTGLAVHRAEYGAHPVGHFGLNLPAYLHFTSPIRRYADLVTQRQVLAHVLGLPLPHTQEDVAGIATHINATLAMQRAEAEARAKDRAVAEVERVVGGGDGRRLDALSAVEFERAVTVVTRSGEDCPEIFAEVFSRRLADGRVSVLCTTLVLCDPTGQGPRWASLRAQVVGRLARNPEQAVSVLTMAKQLLPTVPAASAVDDLRDLGTSAPNRFEVRWKAGATEAYDSAKTAKGAKQRAAVRLLAALAGVTLVSPWEREAATSPCDPVVSTSDGKDPIMALGERAQATGVVMPTYSFTTTGESHSPVITCVCRYQGRETSGKAGKKQDAKREAARAQLAQVGVLK